MLPKILETQAIARFTDCDLFGHLNNSKYIDYLLNGRDEQLMEQYGQSPGRMALEEGLGWVVFEHTIRYLFPVALMEKVVLQSTLLEINQRDVLVEFRMWDLEKKQLKCLLWTRFVHFNIKEKRATSHSQKILDFYAPVHNPLPEGMDYEQRIRFLRKEARL